MGIYPVCLFHFMLPSAGRVARFHRSDPVSDLPQVPHMSSLAFSTETWQQMIFQTRKLHGSPWLVRGLLSLPIKYTFLSLTHHIIHYDVHLFRHSIPIKSHGKSDGKSRLSPMENHHVSFDSPL